MTKPTRNQPRRRGVILSLELVMVLPILLLVILAIVEFSLLLISTQGVNSAAHMGVRTAALPSSSYQTVEERVRRAAQCFNWSGKQNLVIFVDGTRDDGSVIPGPLERAPTGAEVSVTVSVPQSAAAPDLLRLVGLSMEDRVLTTSFVTRKE